MASEISTLRGAISRAIGHSPLSDANPECISAAAERPRALRPRSSGHSFAAGKASCRYSQIASESTIVSPSTFRAGTRPEGECGRIAADVMSFSWRSGIRVSVKTAPVRLIASHGRSDQVDHFFVPITSSMEPLLQGSRMRYWPERKSPV